MAERIGAAEAKAHFSELIGRVVHAGERFVLERRGRPVAAIVGVGDLERIEEGSVLSPRPRGALALVGLWDGLVEDEEIDAIVDEIYAARESDTGRPVDLGT